MFHTVTERSIGIVTIYLGGPIDGLPIIKATAWRNYLTGKLEQLAPGRVATHAFRVLDPLRGFLLPEALGTDIIAVGATTTPLVNSCNVVGRALQDINKADILIFHAPEGLVVGDWASLPLFMKELCAYCVPNLGQVIPLIQTLIA